MLTGLLTLARMAVKTEGGLWRKAGRRAGLEPVRARRAPREPLRLLVFTVPGGQP